MKKVGILCPVFSIPAKYGVGDFGKASFDFVDFLAKNNFSIWEILPLNKTNDFNSPYGSLCAFAFDEMFVDLDQLVALGLLKEEECKPLKKFSKCKRVDYLHIKTLKLKLFSLAFERAEENLIEKAVEFARKNDFDLYAYYMALLENFNQKDWRKIDKKLWDKNSVFGQKFAEKHKKLIEKYMFFQYFLSTQWKKLKEYATKRGVKIVGDLPIYCDRNSFEVFAHPQCFKLDKNFLPYVTGGCAPDKDGKNGQDWGLCIYDWTELKKEGFQFLIDRFSKCLQNYHYLRLDHYVGYVEHYENSHSKNIKSQTKKEGGELFFQTLLKKFNKNCFVLEDLFDMSDECAKVRDKFNLRGMNILQFAFDTDKKNPHLPQNVKRDNFFYLGNHDNNTFLGFLKSQDKTQLKKIKSLLSSHSKSLKNIQKDAIKRMLECKCEFVIFQAQDLLFQGEQYRTNIPGRASGCWEYKLPKNYNNRMRKNLNKIFKKSRQKTLLGKEC